MEKHPIFYMEWFGGYQNPSIFGKHPYQQIQVSLQKLDHSKRRTFRAAAASHIVLPVKRLTFWEKTGRNQQTQRCGKITLNDVAGWTNPFEKIGSSQIGNLPQF